MALYYIQYEKAFPNTASGAGFVVDPQSMVDGTHGVSIGYEGDMPKDFMNEKRQPQYNYVDGRLVKKESIPEQKEMPTVDDRFDAVFKALAEVTKTIPLPKVTTDMIASCEAVTAQEAKP